jgi:hypothetical protein
MQPNAATNLSHLAPEQEMTMFDRRGLILACGTVMFAGLTSGSLAHHGWSWAEGEMIEVTGVIKSAKLGNPHGMLKMAAKDGEWTVEVGQPWRNARAGLKDSMLVKGVELTILGNRAKNEKLKVIKAVRVVINGKNYDLYPERIS